MVACLRTFPGGSSPRMRGTLTLAGKGMVLMRIIPADAGNTPLTDSVPGVGRDHPRGCGEHEYAQIIQYVNQGSSPRMRGTLY